MTEEEVFAPDDERGWPVIATILVRLDPQDPQGVRISSEGSMPKGLLVSCLLATFSEWMESCDFSLGMHWHTGGHGPIEGGGERHHG